MKHPLGLRDRHYGYITVGAMKASCNKFATLPTNLGTKPSFISSELIL